MSNRDYIIETEFGRYRVAPGNLRRSTGWVELHYPSRYSAMGEWERLKTITLTLPRERVLTIEQKHA